MVTVALLGSHKDRQMVISALCAHFDFTFINIVDSKSVNSGLQNLDITKNSLCVERSELLNTVTSRWRENFVVELELGCEELVLLEMRPFVLLVGVTNLTGSFSLEFMQFTHTLAHLVLYIKNKDLLIEQLAKIDMCNPSWLRPPWDTYFMQMAYLASNRSNCMKRRVGAILVNDNRVVATGYNGTARSMLNCNEGGCKRCNSNTKRGLNLGECLCLHAEENAILEAGASKAKGGTLYSTTAPCLNCAKKIVQVGVIRVVYDLEYNATEHDSETYFMKAGVKLEKHSTRQRPHFICI